jgi:hypothetical protein
MALKIVSVTPNFNVMPYWSSPRVKLDLPAVAKPYRLSFVTEGTETTEFFSVLCGVLRGDHAIVKSSRRGIV